ncbi:MAG: sugar phosphate isomerase/epimerase family protein [Candidatus Aenigmatarchaeota archaeon]
MIIGCSTLYGLLTNTIDEILKNFHDNNISAVELVYEYPHIYSKEEIKAIKGFDFDYSMHCPFIYLVFTHPNPAIRKVIIRMIEKSLDAGRKIGIKEYVIHGGLVPMPYKRLIGGKPHTYFLDLWINEIRPIIKKARDYGIRILAENLSPREIFGNPDDYEYIKNKVPELGFCFDIAHAVVYGNIERWLSYKTNYIHITDNNLTEDQHLAVGDGKIKFNEILPKLSKNIKIIAEPLSFEDCILSVERIKKMFC